MKKLLSMVIAFTLAFSSAAAFASQTEDELKKTAKYVYEHTQAPVSGSVGGEWAVFGLARSGYGVDTDYFLKFAEDVEAGKSSTPEQLENPRIILALTSIGMDASDFKGENLYTPLLDTEKVNSFGVNAAAWALLALDCENYEADGAEEKYIAFLLKSVLADGGFAYSGTAGGEPDVTAIVLQALSPYTEREDVKAVVDGALECLSEIQRPDGGFLSWGEESAESTLQVIIALNSLGIPLDDERFVKTQGLFENLMSFSDGNGGFKHIETDKEANAMTTEQALYALSSAERAESGKAKLYDLSGVSKIRVPRFSDIADSPYGEAIEILAEKDVINGISDTEFNPYGDVTRAEYAAIIVRALGIKGGEKITFEDVKENDWFYDSVCAAYGAGIIEGVSDTEFNPYGKITREESTVMTARAARYVGTDIGITADDEDAAEKEYADFNSVASWAESSAVFCFASGITSFQKEKYLPQKNRTREETAQMIYNLLAMYTA